VKDEQLLLCPCCKVSTETVTHVLQCPSNPSKENAIKEFRKELSPKDPHLVFILIKEGVHQWLESNYHPEVDYDQFPPHLREGLRSAVSSQEEIGWGTALRGYMSIEWRQVASCDMGGNPATNEGQGMQRMRAIHKAMHNLTQTLWRSRNQALHGSQEVEMRNIRQAELTEIIEYHQNPDLVPAGDRHYCAQTVDSLLRRAPSTRRRWLRHMRLARLRFKTDGKNQRMITNYFRRREVM
jgi:hypothetical protein